MPKKPKLNVPCVRIVTRIHIMVDEGVTAEQLKELDEKLTETWDDLNDDNNLYKAMSNWLESAGCSGDFNVDQPDIGYYDRNKREITGIW